jgi:hypothetical protein
MDEALQAFTVNGDNENVMMAEQAMLEILVEGVFGEI